MLAQIYNQIDTAIKWVDDRIWGLPLIILILTTGIYLTVRLGGLQIRHLPKALRFMVKNEEEGHGEVTSFFPFRFQYNRTVHQEHALLYRLSGI